MSPPNRVLLRIVSEELARWIVSYAVGICITFWAMLLSLVVSPGILQSSLKSVVKIFFLSALLASLPSYLIFFTRGRWPSR